MIYPNDANGDALRRMEAQGDDLSRPRNIDFSVVFSDKNSADEFARVPHSLRFVVQSHDILYRLSPHILYTPARL
jgi:hypothetical protein